MAPSFRHRVESSDGMLAGCSKMAECTAPEILRNETYLDVRSNEVDLFFMLLKDP